MAELAKFLVAREEDALSLKQRASASVLDEY
jgi:hypothetical protein